MKDRDDFRLYDKNETKHNERVKNHYKLMRLNQTVENVNRIEKKWLDSLINNPKPLTLKESIDVLGSYVDSSDPDNELPNIMHGFQTAEAIRKSGLPDWLQLTGLLHDFGKIMFAFELASDEDGTSGKIDGPQWGLGGDTFVIGARLPDVLVHSEFNKNTIQ